MKIDILSLFPEMFAPLKTSILKRASEKGIVEINTHNIRDFSKDKHKKCDDEPYGGGAGMVMTPQPIFDAVQSVKTENSYVILTSPRGTKFSQRVAERLKEKQHLIFICGHYEGIDERISELCVDEEISIGDYVLTGGEIPAMVMCDAVLRLVPGVISEQSTLDESFSTDDTLEYPQYTRPQEFMGLKVPDVLIGGNHGEIDAWRKEQSRLISQKIKKENK